MGESNKHKIWQITIRYQDGEEIYISGQEIEKMIKAADALDMIHNAKQVAERLSKL